MKTTLKRIRSHSPCLDGWQKLLKHLGETQADDEELSLLTILESNGLDDTLWCFRAVEGFDREKRLYAVWCASQVKHLLDPASRKVLEVATKFANGEATEVELRKATDAAWTAPRGTAGPATWAAALAGDASQVATRTVTEAAAEAATRTVAEAAAEAEAGKTAILKQEQELKRVLECIEAGKDPYPRSST